MRGHRRSLDLAASAPRLILRGIATGLGLTTTRAHRRQVDQVAEARFPGRLRILDARSLFPRSTGSRFTFAVADDEHAVVRLLVEESTGDLGAALDAAVADALAAAAELRCLLTAFAGRGFPVVALEPGRLVPGVVARLTDDTAAATLAAIGAAAREWTSEHTCQAHPTDLGAAAQVTILSSEPGRGDGRLPVPLRLARAAAAVDAPRHVASYPVVDGVAGTAPSTLYVRRNHAVRAAFEERVLAQSAAWLRTARPGAAATRCSGLWPLLPGRVAEATGHVLVTRPPRAPGQEGTARTRAHGDGRPRRHLRHAACPDARRARPARRGRTAARTRVEHRRLSAPAARRRRPRTGADPGGAPRGSRHRPCGRAADVPRRSREPHVSWALRSSVDAMRNRTGAGDDEDGPLRARARRAAGAVRRECRRCRRAPDIAAPGDGDQRLGVVGVVRAVGVRRPPRLAAAVGGHAAGTGHRAAGHDVGRVPVRDRRVCPAGTVTRRRGKPHSDGHCDSDATIESSAPDRVTCTT